MKKITLLALVLSLLSCGQKDINPSTAKNSSEPAVTATVGTSEIPVQAEEIKIVQDVQIEDELTGEVEEKRVTTDVSKYVAQLPKNEKALYHCELEVEFDDAEKQNDHYLISYENVKKLNIGKLRVGKKHVKFHMRTLDLAKENFAHHQNHKVKTNEIVNADNFRLGMETGAPSSIIMDLREGKVTRKIKNEETGKKEEAVVIDRIFNLPKYEGAVYSSVVGCQAIESNDLEEVQ